MLARVGWLASPLQRCRVKGISKMRHTLRFPAYAELCLISLSRCYDVDCFAWPTVEFRSAVKSDTNLGNDFFMVKW